MNKITIKVHEDTATTMAILDIIKDMLRVFNYKIVITLTIGADDE